MGFPTIKRSRLTLMLQRGGGDGSLKGKSEDEIRAAIADERRTDEIDTPGDENTELGLGQAIVEGATLVWRQSTIAQRTAIMILGSLICATVVVVLGQLLRRMI